MIFQFEQQEVDGYPQLVPCDYPLSEFKKITARWQIGMQEKGGWNSIYLEVNSHIGIWLIEQES
jgi:oligo-1,6-glucosidase